MRVQGGPTASGFAGPEPWQEALERSTTRNETVEQMFEDIKNDDALNAEFKVRYEAVEEADEADKPAAIREFLAFAQSKGYDLGVADGTELTDEELLEVVGGGNIFSDLWSGIKKAGEDLWGGVKKVGQDISDGVKKVGDELIKSVQKH